MENTKELSTKKRFFFMLKRLIKVIGAIPVLMIGFTIEILFCSIRWIFNGKSFPESPIIDRFLFEW